VWENRGAFEHATAAMPKEYSTEFQTLLQAMHYWKVEAPFSVITPTKK